jgi:hypothetical protein
VQIISSWTMCLRISLHLLPRPTMNRLLVLLARSSSALQRPRTRLPHSPHACLSCRFSLTTSLTPRPTRGRQGSNNISLQIDASVQAESTLGKHGRPPRPALKLDQKEANMWHASVRGSSTPSVELKDQVPPARAVNVCTRSRPSCIWR